jgi:hypothetical protein
LAAWLNANSSSNSIREKHIKIDVRNIGDVHVLDCSGKITLGEGTMPIRNSVRDILKIGGRKIVLNLADVNYIDRPQYVGLVLRLSLPQDF